MSAHNIPNEDQLGEGFAFFRWHCFQYPDTPWQGFAHPAYEQTECRRLFRKLNAPQAALDQVLK